MTFVLRELLKSELTYLLTYLLTKFTIIETSLVFVRVFPSLALWAISYSWLVNVNLQKNYDWCSEAFNAWPIWLLVSKKHRRHCIARTRISYIRNNSAYDLQWCLESSIVLTRLLTIFGMNCCTSFRVALCAENDRRIVDLLLMSCLKIGGDVGVDGRSVLFVVGCFIGCRVVIWVDERCVSFAVCQNVAQL